MQTGNGRAQAWRDTLSEEELDVALRVGDMPTAMAMGWLAVRVYRIEQSLVRSRPLTIAALNTAGGGMGAAFALGVYAALKHLGLL